jgi:hypothetical protein
MKGRKWVRHEYNERIIPRCIDNSVFVFSQNNSERYVRLILSPFFDKTTDDEKSYGHFKQNNSRAHTTNNSLVAFMKSSANEL